MPGVMFIAKGEITRFLGMRETLRNLRFLLRHGLEFSLLPDRNDPVVSEHGALRHEQCISGDRAKIHDYRRFNPRY